MLTVARRGAEQVDAVGNGYPFVAPTLLITGRAERSGEAVNLVAAALRPLNPGILLPCLGSGHDWPVPAPTTCPAALYAVQWTLL